MFKWCHIFICFISERRDDNQTYYYHYNHIGSTTAISEASGAILFRFVYDTYGELSDITTDEGISLKTSEKLTEYRLAELANAMDIDYLYNGQYGVETDTNGLYYMRARYYNQDIKRFINRDVVSGDITNSQSLNRYCYVQGNPVSLIDPFGLCPTPEEVLRDRIVKAISNTTHWLLDAVGFVGGIIVPGFGDLCDAINAGIYVAEEEYGMAAVSIVCAIPFVGTLLSIPAKYVMKHADELGAVALKYMYKNHPEVATNISKWLIKKPPELYEKIAGGMRRIFATLF